MTCDQLIGSSRASSRKAGTTRKVTAVTMPSAPRPTRAASNRFTPLPSANVSPPSGDSAEQVTIRPSASTSSRPAIWAAIPPTSRPVPWVPVWVAPDTVWTWMSPMLARERPRASSSALSTCSGQPASTVTVPAAGSTDRMAVSRSGRSSTPSQTAAGVKEWPLPVMRTSGRRPRPARSRPRPRPLRQARRRGSVWR